MRRLVSKLFKPLMFVLCLGLLCWMVVKAGPLHLWHTLLAMPGTIALVTLVWGVGYLLNALSFREVLYAIHPPFRSEAALSFRRILRLTVSGYAINYVTPFGLLGGEPYRVLALRPLMGTEKASCSVVLYSSMHIVSHFCFWGLAAVAACFCLDTGVADGSSSSVVALSLTGFLSLFDWRRLPGSARCRALIYEFISRMINVLEYLLIMQALGYSSFGYLEAFLCVAFSSLFANVLFFSPMQMGTREGGIFLAFQYLLPELPAEQMLSVAISVSFATRIREIIWIVVGLLSVEGRMPSLSGINKNTK